MYEFLQIEFDKITKRLLNNCKRYHADAFMNTAKVFQSLSLLPPEFIPECVMGWAMVFDHFYKLYTEQKVYYPTLQPHSAAELAVDEIE